MKELKRIFLYLILICYVFLVDINVEGQLAISAFAQGRETIFEEFNIQLESIVDSMTDEKHGVIFVFFEPIYIAIYGHNDFTIWSYEDYINFAPDASHLIRIKGGIPYSLIYRDKLNGLTWADREEAESIIQALVKGEEINLRYYEDKGNRYQQVDTKIQNDFLGFVYCKAAKLFGWKDLGVSPELPPVTLDISTIYRENIISGERIPETRVTVQGNPSLTLCTHKGEGVSYASIYVEGLPALSLDSNGKYVSPGFLSMGFGRKNLIIRDSNGIIVLKGEIPGMFEFKPTEWPEEETAAKKAFKFAPLGRIELREMSWNTLVGSANLYGFKELWQWGVDNYNFPILGVEAQEKKETVFRPDSSLLTADSTMLSQDIQSCNIVWEKTFGGPEYDSAFSIIQTTDGGYAVAGITSSKGAGEYDVWIIKLDSYGDIVWEKTYGGSEEDYAFSIIQTTDGGYVVAGFTYSKGAGEEDAWILKLDSKGDIVWEKTYGGSECDVIGSIIQTTDGGYAAAGFSSSKGANEEDVWIIKLDSKGDIVWEKTYGGKNYDDAYSIIQTTDGGYAVAGITSPQGAYEEDAWIIKLDSKGDVVWEKTYGGSNNDYTNSIIQTTDGGYAAAGFSSSKGAYEEDAWIIKLDSKGDIVWEKTYGGKNYDDAYSIIQTTDGGYAVAGSTSSKGAGEYDVWIIKLDSYGDIVWEKTYGGSEEDYAFSIIQTTDGGYVVAGRTVSKGAGEEDTWVIKLDEQGNLNSD